MKEQGNLLLAIVLSLLILLGFQYFFESPKIEKEVETYFNKIDELGGVIPAIEMGYFQNEIAKASSDYQKRVDSKRRIIVGVNEFVKETEEIKQLEIKY